MSKPSIPYNRPPVEGNEALYLQQVLANRKFSGDGTFTQRCHQWLEQNLGTRKSLLTHSCTAAMEMSTILADVGPGDEVILPSFTFSSTANAIALRGATPVFIDCRSDNLNIDENKVEAAITPKTKAVFAVHYAGVGCEMDALQEICKRRGLVLLEDAAQAMLATYKGRMLGTIGSLGSLSFHETKNIVSGEGGALLINDEKFSERAEIIREKGTNRQKFFRGQVDKYTWVDIGSSYLPSELIAAMLLAQFENARRMTDERVRTWNHYHEAFKELESRGFVRRPIIPKDCVHNGHIYYLLTRNLEERTALISHLKNDGISAPFHYVSLHLAPAGIKFGRAHGSLENTDMASNTLLRLPLFVGLTASEMTTVIESVQAFYRKRSK